MTDSFFTSRNMADPQVAHAPSVVCEHLIEASLRRIAKLEGPLEASKRIQRLADICAGAYVLPIEHWSELGKIEAKPAAAPGIPRWRLDKRFNRFVTKYPMLLFYIGLFAGMAIRGVS